MGAPAKQRLAVVIFAEVLLSGAVACPRRPLFLLAGRPGLREAGPSNGGSLRCPRLPSAGNMLNTRSSSRCDTGVNQVTRVSSAFATTSQYVGQTGCPPAGGPIGAARTNAQLPGSTPALAANGLPRAGTVLAVTARPGVESADLGALLYAFGQAGARLALLSLTRGEASPVNSTHNRLEAVRPPEMQLASWLLGVSSIAVSDYPDGGLRHCQMSDLTARVQRAIAEHAPDLILVLDPATGDCDDAQVAQAACLAAESAGVPVAARTIHGAHGGWPVELGGQADTARAVQRSAARAHASQSETLPEVFASLDSLGSHEQLRWLLAPAIAPERVTAPRISFEGCREAAPALV
jgi:N-acetylglucosamine malate deacetylase 2